MAQELIPAVQEPRGDDPRQTFQRIRSAWDRLRLLINQLILSGDIIRDGSGWRINFPESSSGGGSQIIQKRDGSSILFHSGPPPQSLGKQGDVCFDLTFQSLYRKEEAFFGSPPAWVHKKILKGDKGDKGEKGDKGDPGRAGDSLPQQLSEWSTPIFTRLGVNRALSTTGMLEVTGHPSSFNASIYAERTPTVTSGTVSTFNSQLLPAPTANTAGLFIGFNNSVTVNGSVSQDFTGVIYASNYAVQLSGTGAYNDTNCLTMILQQNAGAGAILRGKGCFANSAFAASASTITLYDSATQVNNAAGAVTLVIHYRATATGTITAGGAITTIHGFQSNNHGKTGVTNAIGMSIADQSGAATANIGLLMGTTTAPSGSWGIYNQSANNNYYAGIVLIGTTTATGASLLQISAGNPDPLIIATTTTTTTVGDKDARLLLQCDSNTAFAGGEIVFCGADTTTDRYASIGADVRQNTASGMRGDIYLATKPTDTATTLTRRLTVFSVTEMVANDNGDDYDFRVEGDTATNLFVCDAGTDAVRIGTTTAGVIAHFATGGIVFNEDGTDRDIRFEGDTDVNLFFTDAGNDRVGIGTNAPATKAHVAGTLRANQLRVTDATELTIATGAITITQSYHKVDTQADAATDDLDTISGGVAGDILILRAESSSRDVVVKDGTGNIQCAGDMTLDNVQDTITLLFDGSNWIELARSNNSA